MASLIIRFFSSLIPSSQRTNHSWQQSSQLRGAKRLSGGAKFEIKHKSAVFKRVSLLIGWEGASMLIGVQVPHGLPLAPALVQTFATLRQR